MKRRVRSTLRSARLVGVTCVLFLTSVTGASALQPAVRLGKAPPLPSGAQDVTPLSATKQLELTVALKSQNPTGLADFANGVSAPSSPSFRNYLTVAQFARRFGATPAQVAAVRSALQAQGASVGPVAANALTLPVRGTAAQLEKAFSISLAQVTLPSGRTAYTNTEAPAIPASAAQFVQGVIGLDNVSLDQPAQATRRTARATSSGNARPNFGGGLKTSPGGTRQAQIATGGPQPCTAAQALQTPTPHGAGETADEIATAYQLTGLYKAGDLGGGQTIAVFEQEAFRPQDIAAYQACYGTSATVTTIDVAGGPEPYEGEDTEAALDIEQIIGLAPQAHVLVYQGPIEQNAAPIEIISRIVSDDSAEVISTSWGFCEAETELHTPGVIGAENTLLQEAAVQGQSFYAASGDSGSQQCSQVNPANESLSVMNPASQPFATGVGGTTLYSVSEGNKLFYTGALPPTEGIWNDGPRSEGGGGTGGGVSKTWGMPSYQSGAAAGVGVINSESSGAPCGLASPCREVPDVAANADPATGYVVFVDGDQPGGGWNIVGGTSASAPLWAALTGLANSSPACRGTPIGFANPALYSIAGSNYAGNFRDVFEPSPFTHVANNDTLFGVGPFSVTSGYDMTTGVGAPLGANLAASLCALAAPPVEEHTGASSILPSAGPASSTSSGALSSVTAPPATINPAALAAQLERTLAPSGKGAKIAMLLKARGLSVIFKALEPGSVVIDWYELPPGAKLATSPKAKPVLVAAGHLTFTTTGTGIVKLKITAAGKALLKRAKQLKLTAKGTFTPTGKTPISVTRALLLRR